MSFAVSDLSEGFGCVLLVGDLSAKKVAGFRWVRERIGRVDLAGESLIERSHRVQIRLREGSDRSPPLFFSSLLCSSASQGEPTDLPPKPKEERGSRPDGILALVDKHLQTEPRRRAAGCSLSSQRRNERCTRGVSSGAHLHSLHGVIPSSLLSTLPRAASDKHAAAMTFRSGSRSGRPPGVVLGSLGGKREWFPTNIVETLTSDHCPGAQRSAEGRGEDAGRRRVVHEK